MKVRTAAKAIITKDQQILFIQKQDDKGYYYLLPGGGQEHGESMKEAIIRECKEEVMVDVEVGEVLFVRDYIEKNHEFARPDSNFHQLEIMFHCQIVGDQKPENGINPDIGQIGVNWIAVNELDEFRVYPKQLRQYLLENKAEGKIYLGDIN